MEIKSKHKTQKKHKKSNKQKHKTDEMSIQESAFDQVQQEFNMIVRSPKPWLPPNPNLGGNQQHRTVKGNHYSI